jgi:hypothetical protein
MAFAAPGPNTAEATTLAPKPMARDRRGLHELRKEREDGEHARAEEQREDSHQTWHCD